MTHHKELEMYDEDAASQNMEALRDEWQALRARTETAHTKLVQAEMKDALYLQKKIDDLERWKQGYDAAMAKLRAPDFYQGIEEITGGKNHDTRA